MMDAREKWVKAAEELADQMSFSDSCSLLYSGTKGVNYEVEFMTKRAELFAHLRTTPEGFALVPVPEWVKVADGLPVVPEGERYVVVWGWSSLYRDAPALKRWYPDMTEGTTLNTHWQYRQDDTPAPPEEA